MLMTMVAMATMMMIKSVQSYRKWDHVYSSILSFLEIVELEKSNNSARSDSEIERILSKPRYVDLSQKG